MNGKIEHTNKRMKRPQGRLQTQHGACGCGAGGCISVSARGRGRGWGREPGRAGGRGAVTFGVGAAAAVYVAQATNTV